MENKQLLVMKMSLMQNDLRVGQMSKNQLIDLIPDTSSTTYYFHIYCV